MHKILIIEDELPARKKLKRYIAEVVSAYEIVAELETIEEALAFLSKAPELDLIFSDIELRDGNAFEIYNVITPKCPIIFATAYNEFLVNAFETNGIEYLLKPYSLDRFKKAWDKFMRLNNSKTPNAQQLMTGLQELLKNNSINSKTYKEQWAIKSAQETYFLKTERIVYFQAEDGVVFAFDDKNKRHTMSKSSLMAIEEELNPQDFFRINRGECIHRKFIDKLQRFNKNTISVFLNAGQVSLRTSQNKTSDFNSWLDA